MRLSLDVARERTGIRSRRSSDGYERDSNPVEQRGESSLLSRVFALPLSSPLIGDRFLFYSLTNAVLLERSYFARARTHALPTRLRNEDLEITADTSRILRSVSRERYRNTASPLHANYFTRMPNYLKSRRGESVDLSVSLAGRTSKRTEESTPFGSSRGDREPGL